MKHHDLTSTLQLGEPLATARSAIILLHGRGSSGADIAGLADLLQSTATAWLAPHATRGAWYPERFLAPLTANEPWLTSALEVVDQRVGEARAAGVLTARIGLVGFSQGACLALEYAARRPDRYALVAALSGALIGPLDTPRGAFDLRGTPVLLGCAEADAHIPLPYVERSAATLAASGAEVTKQIYPGAVHGVFPPEIAWLNARLAALR